MPAVNALAPPRRLPGATAILAVGAVAMFAWEDSAVSTVPAARTGLLVLAAAAVALIHGLRRAADDRVVANAAEVWADAGDDRGRRADGQSGLDQHSHERVPMRRWRQRTVRAGRVGVAGARCRPDRLPKRPGGCWPRPPCGCVLAGVLALAGAHGASIMAPGSLRLAGTYGNSNDLAATQAIGLPIAVAALVQCRSRIVRVLALAGSTDPGGRAGPVLFPLGVGRRRRCDGRDDRDAGGPETASARRVSASSRSPCWRQWSSPGVCGATGHRRLRRPAAHHPRRPT